MRNLISIILLILIQFSCSENSGKTKGAAENIIASLEKYKVKNGVYPDSLPLLVPNYLVEVPKSYHSVRDNRFFYAKHLITKDTSKLEFFELWYSGPLMVEAKYNSLLKKWEYDD